MTAKQFRNKLEQKKGQLFQINSSISKSESEIFELDQYIEDIERARLIIQNTAKETQNQLTYRISNLITTCLESIFPDPYEFDLDFVIRRNKTEADMNFVKGEDKFHPMTASGGGVVDLVSFILRPICYSLQNPKSRNAIIYDEPLKFLSKDLLEKANEMIQMLSEKLGLQMIIVTHLTELEGDRVFNVLKQRNGESKIIYC